jgi:thioredoxin-related protein
VIVGIAVFLVIAVHTQFWKSKDQPKSQAAMAEALRGKTIQVSGLSFPRQRASVLLVISTSCHFCEESLPFYRTLSGDLQGKADLLAVLPQSQAEAAAFLNTAHVEVTQIATASLSQLGVTGTPTLLLLDPSGKVQEVWLGRLDESKQAQVRSRLAQL